jgi:hypothetical protein
VSEHFWSASGRRPVAVSNSASGGTAVTRSRAGREGHLDRDLGWRAPRDGAAPPGPGRHHADRPLRTSARGRRGCVRQPYKGPGIDLLAEALQIVSGPSKSSLPCSRHIENAKFNGDQAGSEACQRLCAAAIYANLGRHLAGLDHAIEQNAALLRGMQRTREATFHLRALRAEAAEAAQQLDAGGGQYRPAADAERLDTVIADIEETRFFCVISFLPCWISGADRRAVVAGLLPPSSLGPRRQRATSEEFARVRARHLAPGGNHHFRGR